MPNKLFRRRDAASTDTFDVALTDTSSVAASSAVVRSAGERPVRRAFVLTGGGNLGAAQVGQLQALCDAGVTPDVLVGVSVGALNAAFVSHGFTADRLEVLASEWAALDAERVFGRLRIDPALALLRRRTSLFDGDALRATVERLCPLTDLGEAMTELWVATCPLGKSNTRWWSQGPAVDVLCASAALPGVLPPVLLDDGWHIDGGVLDNVPVSFAMSRQVDEVYILDASSSGADVAPTSSLGVLLSAFNTVRMARMIEQIATAGLAVPIWWMPTGVLPDGMPTMFDFSRSRELMDVARTATTGFLEETLPGLGG